MSIDVAHVLKAINASEGSPKYTDPPHGSSSASGAYQFVDATWRGAGGSTAHAYQASQAEQDAVASSQVNRVIAAHSGLPDDQLLAVIAENWYIGHDASAAELKTVPPGNHLTVQKYVDNFKRYYGYPDIGDATAPSEAQKIATAAAGAVTSALGALADPFLAGLKKISILGVSLLLGLGLVGAGAWRSVKANG